MDSRMKKFTCEVCGWGCGRIGNMVSHRKSHTTGGDCGQQSTTKAAGSTCTLTAKKPRIETPNPSLNLDWRISCPTIRDKHLHLLNSGNLSDVIFLVGDKKAPISAHKFILIVASPVFESQFGERWDQENEIEIPEVTPTAFRMFLEYLYADIFSVTENEAPGVLFLAHKYLTNGLAKKCTDLLSSVINVSNVIQIHQTATKFSEKNLENQAMEYILSNASAVFEGIGFLQIGMDTLSSILKSDKLVTEEIVIFRAVMRWAEKKCKDEELDWTVQNKRIVLKDLIPLIRFTLMTSVEFTNEVNVGVHEGIMSDAESNSVYKYWNVGQSMRTSLPSLPFNVNQRKRCHENLYKVDVYEAGVGFFQNFNCTFDSGSTSSVTTPCDITLKFRSDRNIQIMGIELRLQSKENPMNLTYLAFTNPKSDSPVQSDISAVINHIKESSYGGRTPAPPDGIFLPRSLTSELESGFQIEKNYVYCITLRINGRSDSGQSSIKSISPGVGLKLANPAICEENNVKFGFSISSAECVRQGHVDFRSPVVRSLMSFDDCICTGLIKSIHFKI